MPAEPERSGSDPAGELLPRTFKLIVAYDGAAFHGWQRQPDRVTVQGTLEQALERLTEQPVSIVGSSRTDAGVHALGQVASFQMATRLPVAAFERGLNAFLPAEIRVLSASEADSGFHAIGSSRGKRYRYLLADRPLANPFWGSYVWTLPRPLDNTLMHAAGQALVGKHDFASFVTGPVTTQTTVRTIFALEVRRGRGGDTGQCFRLAGADDGDLLVVEVTGDGFLYNMVRTIVGTLVRVGLGQRPTAWVAEVLAARDRRAAGMTAPAQGLFLVEVFLGEPAGDV